MRAPVPNFVVVGGGQAARWIVITLRQEGYDGPIVWMSDEPRHPYERPPLSKSVLLGSTSVDEIALFRDDTFESLAVDWRAGCRVKQIDRSGRFVRTSDGGQISYSCLFLATGGCARQLEGVAAHPRIHTLRTAADALQIKRQLDEARHVLVLGGGWIGLEVAASARSRGRRVTLVEAVPRLCQRSVPPVVSEYLRTLHQEHGVDLQLGAMVSGVHADSQGVTLGIDGGDSLRGDMLVVGIGMQPNSGLAASAGLATDNGIVVDADCRTSDPHIFAAGDVANGLRSDGRRSRLESWDNAQRMGITAARAALGQLGSQDDKSPAWFWSDQYEENLQILGTPDPGLRIVERDSVARRHRVMYFCTSDRIEGVVAINAGREIKVARKWMTNGSFPNLDDLQSTAMDVAKLPCTAAQQVDKGEEPHDNMEHSRNA